MPEQLEAAVRDRCEEFDRSWSRFREDSVVTRIARTPGRHRLAPEAPELFDLYRTLYDASKGAVSPLVGRALEQWGYDAAYRLKPESTIAPIPAWDDALGWDGEHLDTVAPVVLDIGAVGKGFLVDLLAEVLERHGVADFTIDASGDILYRGVRPLRVALENPLDTSRAIGVVELERGAICASASNRRSWPGAHHIIDAVTGRPTERVIATWAMAERTAVADGIATALFFVGSEGMGMLESSYEFEWVRMSRTGVVETSSGFTGEVFA